MAPTLAIATRLGRLALVVSLTFALLATPLLAAPRWEKREVDGKTTYVRVDDDAPAAAESRDNRDGRDSRFSRDSRNNRPGADPSRQFESPRPSAPRQPEPAMQSVGPASAGIAIAPVSMPGRQVGPFFVEVVPTSQPDAATAPVKAAPAGHARQPVEIEVIEFDAPPSGQADPGPAQTQPDVAGVPSSQPDVARAPSSQPDVARAAASQPDLAGRPTGQPEGQTGATDAPAVKPVAAAGHDGEARIRFAFANESLPTVLEHFSRLTGLSIIGNTNVQGTVTYYSARGYTVDEALGVLNSILMTRQLYLVRGKEHLMLVPLTQVRQLPLPVYRGELPARDVQPSDIVTFVLGVPSGANLMSAQLKPLVSQFGAVTAMGDTNLVITDTVENIRSIERVLKALAQPSQDALPGSELRVFPLANAGPDEMVQYLVQMMGTPVTRKVKDPQGHERTIVERRMPGPIMAERRTNSIVAMAGPEDLAMIDEIIKRLDVPTEQGAAIETRMFTLTNTDVNRASEVIRNAFSGQQRRDRNGRPVTSTSEIRVTVDPQFRRLIITATTDRIAEIDELLRDLEKVQVEEAEQFRVVRLSNQQSNQMGEALRRFVRPQREMRLEVMEDPRTNSLMLQSNSPVMMTRAMELIKQLDVADVAAGQTAKAIRIVELTGVEGGRAVQHINTMLINTGKLGDPRPTIDVTGDGKALLVSCSEKQWEQISTLLDDIQKLTPEEKSVTETLAIKNQKPTDIERAVQQFLGDGGRPRWDPAQRRMVASTLRTIADDSRGVLIVDATPTLMQQVKQLVGQLDVAPGAELQAELRTYEMTSPQEARDVRDALRRAFDPEIQAGRMKASIEVDNDAAMIFVSARPVDYVRIDPMVEKVRARIASMSSMRRIPLQNADARELVGLVAQIVSGQGGQVRMAPSNDGRFVVATGSPADVDMVAKLLGDLDQPDTRTAPSIRVIQLQSADPNSVASTLGDIYRELNQMRRRENKAEVRFRGDAGSRRLFVLADNDAFAQIEPLVKDLDAVGTPVSDTRLVSLNIARAGELVGILSSLYSGRQGFEQLRLAVDNNQNAVVVSAPAPQMAEIVAMIATLDGSNVAADVQTRSYEVAEGLSAGPLAQALQLALADEIRTQKIVAQFRPEPMSNTLFISARPADFAAIDQQIQKLKTRIGTRTETRQFATPDGSGWQWVSVLQNVLSGRQQDRPQAEQLRLAADPRGTTIFAVGAPDLLDAADKLLKAVNIGEGGEPVVRIVRLTQGDAQQMANTVRQSLGAGQGGARVAGATARVTPDPASNSLILTGAESEVAAVQQLISKLEESANVTRPYVLKVQHIWPSDAATMINDLFARQPGRSAPITMSADTAGSQLVLVTTPSQFELISKIIEQVDVPPVEPVSMQFIPLFSNQPNDLIAKLRPVIDSKYGKDRGPTLEADALTGTLIVSGTLEQRLWVESVVAELESGDSTGGDGGMVTEYIPVPKEVSAAKLAGDLGVLYQQVEGVPVKIVQFGRNPGEGGTGIIIRDMGKAQPVVAPQPAVPPTTQPAGDRQSRAAGQSSQVLAKVARTVALAALGQEQPHEEIEEPVSGDNPRIGPGVRVVRPPASTQPEQPALPPTIFVDPITNSLVVQGTSSQVRSLRDLIDSLASSTTGPDYEIRIYKLTSSPDAMADTLEKLFNERRTVTVAPGQQAQQPQPQPGGRRGGRGGEQPQQNGQPQPGQPQQRVQTLKRITVVADLRTNAVIVKAAPPEFPIIEAVIQSLDVGLTGGTLEVRVFTLSNIEAAEAERNLKALFRLVGGGGGQESSKELDALRQQVIQMQRDGAVNGETLELLSAGRMTITANQAANSVIVAAPPEGLMLVAQLLDKLDKAPVLVDTQVKIIRLKNARAEQVAPVFQNIFLRRQQRGGRNQRQRPGDENLAVSADARSNSLVVRAAVSDMAEIEKLIGELDQPGVGDGILRVYKLNYADANMVSRALEQMHRADRGQPASPIRIAADSSSNCLLITAPVMDHERLAKLISEIDAGGLEMQLKIYRLKVAQAGDVARSVGQVLRDPSRRRQGRPEPQISADTVTNVVMVRASAEDHVQIAELIKELESAGGPAVRQQAIQLKNAQAVELVPVLVQLYGGNVRGGRGAVSGITMTITADARSNRVLASGTESQIADLVKLVEELDQAAPTGQGELRIYRLKFAEANTLGRALIDMHRTGRNEPPSPIKIASDASSNSLLITAPPADHDRLGKLIVSLDSADELESQMQVYTLKVAQADSVARSISNILRAQSRGRSRPTAQVDSDMTTNTLIVRGSAAEHKEIAALIEQLEKVGERATQQVAVELKHAQATDLLTALQPLFTQGGGRGRRGGSSSQGVRLTADARSNKLLVSGSETEIADVLKLVAELDQEGIGNGELKVYQLKYAEASTLSRALEMMHRPDRGQPPSQVKIASDATTNSLLITAPQADHERLAKIIASLDDQQKSVPQMKVYQLKNAQATDVAQAVSVVLRSLPRRQGRAMPSVSGDAMTNTIIAMALPEDQQQIAELIQQLEENGGPARQVRPIPLKHAQAADIVAAVDPLYKQMARGSRGAQAMAVSLTADSRSNHVLVSGTEQQIAEVAALIEQLDRDDAPGLVQTKIVSLVNSDAIELAPMVQKVHDQAMQNTTPRGGKVARVAIGADSRTNSIVLAGPEDQFRQVEELIKQLDGLQPLGGGLKIQVVPLKTSSPEDVRKVIEQMIQGQTQGGGRRPGQSGGGRAMPGVRVDVATAPGANALILSADDKTLAELMKLIEEIEKAGGEVKRKVQIFPLTNAQAQTLAPTLQRIFTEQARAPRGQPARPEDQVSVSAEPTTNAVIVAATEERMGEVETLIKQLDAVQINASGFQVYPLANAEAAKVSQLLTQMLRQSQPTLKFSVSADARTNVLIVNAPQTVFPQVKQIIELLDQVPPFATAVMTVVPLKHASAKQLAPILTSMIRRDKSGAVTPMAASLQEQIRRMQVVTPDGRQVSELDLDKPINITPEDGTNALVISSSQENVTALTALLSVMDTLPITDAITVRIFPVRHGDAAAISTELNDLFNKTRQTVVKPGGGKPGPGQIDTTTAVGKALLNQVSFSVDKRTNTLLVAGVEEAVALVEVLVGQLDQPSLSANIDTQILPVKHGDAGLLAPMLTQLFQQRLTASLAPGAQAMPSDKITIAVEPLTNSLIVVAKKENLEQLTTLLAKLDVEPEVDSGLVRFFPLNYADAKTVADLLNNLYRGGIYVPGRAATGQARPEDKVNITSDLRTNVVIVSGSRQNMAIIEGLLKSLDRENRDGYSDIKLYPVANADATKMATLLQQLFDRKVAAARELNIVLPRPTVTSDARSNLLIVAGRKEVFEEIDRLLPEFDKLDAKSTVIFNLFQLKNASAVTLAPMLNDLMSKRRPTGTQQGTAIVVPVTIVGDQPSNTLIVSASRDDMSIVSELVDKLDKEPDRPETTRIFPLMLADATEMSNTLKQLYASRPVANAITFSVDPRLNVLVVSAAKADMAAIAELVERLDTAQITDLMTLRIFPLENAEADELAKTIESVLQGGAAPGGASAQRATIIKFMAENERAAEAISTQKEKISVTSSPRTNSLIVKAPADSMNMMALLILDLDRPTRVITNIDMFQLRNADAGQMAEVIKELFQLGKTNSNNSQEPTKQYQMQTGPTPPVQTVAAMAGPAGVVSTPGGTPPSPYRPELSVVVDSRTNSLICSGVPEDLLMVRQLVETLDSSDVVERVNKVYALKNAKADEIQTALNNFLRQETQRMVDTLGPDAAPSAVKAIEKEVSVVAVPESNQLLVSASPRYYEQVSQIVNELDQPPPQVLIQVLLAEVTLDDSTELGFDASYKTDVSDGVFKAETAFGVRAAQSLNGGFAVSLTGTDFEFILRALQTQSRLEVLSRPQILASDNKEAEISVGSRVPFVTSVRVTEGGDSFSTVNYEDIGIILKVTPKINPDGFVNMVIAPEISSISDSTVQVSEGLTLPVFNTRSANTTVTVKDNQTVVIGGLIRTTEQSVQSKVPFLGDLPGPLGALWRSSKKVKQRTELLIVLTPRVLRSVEDAARVSAQERDRVSIMPRNVENTELMNIQLPAQPPFSQPIDTQIRVPGGDVPLPPPNAPTPPDTRFPGATQGRGPTSQPDAAAGEEQAELVPTTQPQQVGLGVGRN